MTLNYSILTSSTNQAKTLSLVDGKIVKSSLANATSGRFSAHSVESLNDFAEALNNITVKQSLIIGSVVRKDGIPLAVGEKIGLCLKGKETDKSVSRSKDFIQNLPVAGFMLFDIDGSSGNFSDLQSFIHEFVGIGAVVKPSSSSLIYDKNGNEIVGEKGRHIFVPVKNMSDVPRVADILWARMWIAGYGFHLVSAGIHPMLLERGLFDRTVLGKSERLAFEAKPILNDGLIQKYNHAVVIDGDILDTSIIKDLTPEETAQYHQAVKESAQKIRPEYDKTVEVKKREYIASGKSLADYESLKRRELPPDFEVNTSRGVFKVCDLSAEHDRLTMADPFEPDYDGGSTTKAIFFWNKGFPKINSQAHGGIVYKIQSTAISGELLEESNDWKKKLDDLVIEFNKTHSQVIIGGKYRIMRRVSAEYAISGRDGLEFLHSDTMDGIYTNTIIQTGWNNQGFPVYRTHYQAWAMNPKSDVYRGGVIFKPSVNPPTKRTDYYNTWQGYSVQPRSDSRLWALIKYHIDEVICQGNQELIDYVYNWIAYSLQYPDKPAGSAIVCKGSKGSGKGTIGHFLKNLWGNHGVHISNAKHLTGNFNGHLANTCFLFVDEAFFSADKQHEGVLKALITEPTLTIEYKGIDPQTCPNYLKIFMATNNTWAVPATKDERRFAVCNVADTHCNDIAYFKSLHNDINNKDVQSAFLYDMLARDVSDYSYVLIPETDGLKEQRLHSLDSVGKWLHDSLSHGCFMTKDNQNSDWDEVITSSYLWQSYVFWCDTMKIGEYGRTSQTHLGRYLNDIGFIRRERPINPVARIFGSIDNAKRMFCKYERVSID